MKAKSVKTPTRVKVNTGLFILLAIVLGAMTYCGASKLKMFSKNFRGISDAPGLCYDEDTYKKSNASIVEDTYPCSTQSDENGNPLPATSDNDYAMFLYDHTTFSGAILSNELIILVTTIGSMLTLASLAGGIIYWNHNR